MTETTTEATTATVTEKTTETTTQSTTASTTEKDAQEESQSASQNTTETAVPTASESTTESTTETTTKRQSSGGGGGSGGSGGGVFSSSFSSQAKQKKTVETPTETTTAQKTVPKEKSKIKFAKKSLVYIVDSPTAYLDKVPVFVIYSPYIQASSSSMLISVRSLQQGLGSEVKISWRANTKTAVVSYNGHTVEITANRRYMISDGKRVAFKYGAYAEINDGRIYLPFRALGEGLGFKVNWDGEKRAAAYLLE